MCSMWDDYGVFVDDCLSYVDDLDAPIVPQIIAERRGIQCVMVPGLSTPSRVVEQDGRFIIEFRSSLSFAAMRLYGAHELVEIWCIKRKYYENDRELLCDAIAACILIPHVSLIKYCTSETALRKIRQIAYRFKVPPEVAWIRLALWAGGRSALIDNYKPLRAGNYAYQESDEGLRKKVIRRPNEVVILDADALPAARWKRR